MQYFNFDSLIDKYAVEFTVYVPSTGTYDEQGDFCIGEPTELVMSGAIIAFTENKIFRSEGTLTEQDRALYVTSPIDKSLQGATVKYGGKEYNIGNMLENSEFTGVYAYTLKHVSKFG